MASGFRAKRSRAARGQKTTAPRAARQSFVDLEVTVVPDPSVFAAAYDEAADEMFDVRPVWRRLAPEIGASMVGTVRSEGGDIGENWVALTQPYADRKALDGFSGGILVRDGDFIAGLGAGTIVSMSREEFGDRLAVHRLRVGLRGKAARKAAAITFGDGRLVLGWPKALQAKATGAFEAFFDRILRRTIGNVKA